jgi:hypothetical protein
MYRLICILGNRNAGFVLGMVVVLNLAVGSLVMDRFPRLYPPFFPNDLNFFFDPVRIEHAWLYALLVTFSLFTVNLIACIIETVVGMLQSGGIRLKPVAALMFHVALVAILIAHLHDGIYGEHHRVRLDRHGVEVPGLGVVQAEALQRHFHPDGSLKETEATLLFRLADGQTVRKTIAYNEPALFEGGTREVLIQQGGHEPAGVIVTRASDGTEIEFMPGAPHRVAGGHLILRNLYMSQMDVPVADFWFQHPGGRHPLMMVLDERVPRHAQFEIAGERYHYKGLVTSPVALVVVRYNPAIPTVLVGLLLSSIATLLLIRWMRTRRSAAVERRRGREAEPYTA